MGMVNVCRFTYPLINQTDLPEHRSYVSAVYISRGIHFPRYTFPAVYVSRGIRFPRYTFPAVYVRTSHFSSAQPNRQFLHKTTTDIFIFVRCVRQ